MTKGKQDSLLTISTPEMGYEEYEEIESPVIDFIPAHWEFSKIKLHFEVQVGKMLQSSQESSDEVELSYLKARHIKQNGEIAVDDLPTMWFSPKDQENYSLKSGDVLVAEGGDVGRAGIWSGSDEEVSYQNAINRLRARQNDSPRFLYYWITWLKEQGLIEVLCNSATIAHYTAETVADTPLLLPPIKEQRSIVSFLDHHNNRIEGLIKANQRLISYLDEKRDAVIEDSVINGVGNSDHISSGKLVVVEEIPSDWEVRRAKTLFEQRDDRGYDDLPLLEVSLNHGVRFREENEDRTAWTASNLEDMKRVAEDDLVFNKMRLWQGAIGRSDHEGLVSPDYTVLEPRPEANPAYYEHLLRTRAYKTEVNRRSHGVVDDRNRIYWKQFGDMPLLHPSPEEQEEIVRHIERETKQINELRGKVNNAVELLEEKRQALITAAVTGQIDISDWEPSEQEVPA